jgi:outer membrane protein TolC
MNKFHQIFLTIILLFMVGNLSLSQEQLTLTLEDSVTMALAQNPYHLATEERVDAAKAQRREAVASFFPSLNAQGLKTLDEKVFELEFPSFIPGEPPQRVEVDFTRDYQFSMALNIPIFSGGRLISSYKYADYNLKSAHEAVRQSRHSTVFNTKRTFYGILLAREFVRVAEAAVLDAEKLYHNVKVQYEVGLASQFDFLRSEVFLANLKPQLIQARNNLKIMELNLKTLLGLNLETDVDIIGELVYERVEPDLEATLQKALQNRPELKQLMFQKQMAKANLRIARSTALPSVSITGQFNYWADTFNFRKDAWQDFYAINLTMNIPIFNGFAAHARMGRAKAMIKEIDLSQKGLVDMLEFEVRQTVLKLEEAKESLLSQEKNVEQAKESLRIAELNFAEGLITILDISQAQTALTQARTNYSQALYDYKVALADLDRAMGVD